MRGLITCVALLCATSCGASFSAQQNELKYRDLSTTASTIASNAISTEDQANLSSSTASSSIAVTADSTTSSSGAITGTQETSELPTIIYPPDDLEHPVSHHPTIDEPPRRRIITYDQRQEGQYNIRADLENFMIIMVPQTPSLFSELFLTKALKHRPSINKEKSKGKNPFNFLKYQESSKRIPNLNYNVRSFDDASVGVRQTPITIAEVGDITHTRRLPEFIEGRTPYHVDISANDDEQSRLHPDRQVDVLPPPFPLAYQHLKPYHLEAEPTVIQALPPPEHAHATGNFLETYNQLLTSGLKNAVAAEHNSRARHNNDGPESGYYRFSRSIRGGDNALDSDRSNALNSLSSHTSLPRVPELPFYRVEHSLGAASLYPPIDVPKAFGYINTKGNEPRNTAAEYQESTDLRDQALDADSSIGRVIFPTLDITVPQDDVELELHGVSLLDRAAKILLSDGMERCAPGHRRNSYGLCREIEGY